MKDGGKGDQAKQIADLKAELAAAKAKARDFGSSHTGSFILKMITYVVQKS